MTILGARAQTLMQATVSRVYSRAGGGFPLFDVQILFHQLQYRLASAHMTGGSPAYPD